MIGIVGGGLSGLALSHYLGKEGLPHITFEAADVPGGVVRSRTHDGVVLDFGPQRLRLTPEVRSLIAEVGLAEQVIEAPPGLPLFVYRKGRLRRVPTSLREGFRSDLLSWTARLRVLFEPFTAGLKRDETAAEFLRRKFGTETYRALLGPLYGGLYASDPAEMLGRHALASTLSSLGIKRSLLIAFLRRARAAVAAYPAATFREGMAALPDALAAQPHVNLRLGHPVRRIGVRPSGGFILGTDAGTEEVEELVLTAPAPVSAGLLEEVSASVAKRLVSLRYNELAVAHLRSEWAEPGLGYQVAFGEGLETRGVTWNGSLFGREGLSTVYLGGMKNPALSSEKDTRIGAIAEHEFEVVTGVRSEVLNVGRTRVPAWDRSWAALDGLELPAGLHLCGSFESRPGILGRFARAKAVASELAIRSERRGGD